MATFAPEVLEWLADQWEAAVASAECSGIVNDSGDVGKTSKHWSRQDNPSGSWAVTHSKDKGGPANMSAAIDMTMHNQADMFAVHKRFKALYNARATDPRAGYVDCFNGWDGTGSPGRYDLPAGTISGTDDTHKWHEHVETFYQYTGTDAESWKAARAILSVVKGETAQQWLDNEEDDMDQATFDARMDSWLKRTYEAADDAETAVVRSRNYMRAFPWRYIGGGIEPGKNMLAIQNETHGFSKVSAENDVDAEVIADIEQAAREGAMAGAADVDAIVSGVLAGLDSTGLSDEQQADVEAAVRNVFADASNPDA